MASSKVYWNLDGFQDPTTDLVLANHFLELPYSGQRVQTDTTGIPTGEIFENRLDSVWDFWSVSKYLGDNFTSKYIRGNCGANCTGYDNSFLINGRAPAGPYAWTSDYVARLQSKFSGIRMFLSTNRDAVQISTCNHLPNGTIPLKSTQQNNFKRPAFANQYACVVIAPGDRIAGINHPGWMRNVKQAYGPQDGAYVYQAMPSFATTTTVTHCATSTGRSQTKSHDLSSKQGATSTPNVSHQGGATATIVVTTTSVSHITQTDVSTTTTTLNQGILF